jgi:hypothetical protein
MVREANELVMGGLRSHPAPPTGAAVRKQEVDGRDKPGRDDDVNQTMM